MPNNPHCWLCQKTPYRCIVLNWNLYLLLDAWHIIFTYFWHRISIFNLFNSFNILLFDLFLGSLIFEPTCNLFFWNIQLHWQFQQFAVFDDIFTETKIIFFQFFDLVWSVYETRSFYLNFKAFVIVLNMPLQRCDLCKWFTTRFTLVNFVAFISCMDDYVQRLCIVMNTMQM